MWQYIGVTVGIGGSTLARTEYEVLTIHTTAEVKTFGLGVPELGHRGKGAYRVI